MSTESQYRTLAERLGSRLRERREFLRYSLAEVADKCGMSKAGLWQIETARSNASIGIVFRLSRVLQVSIDALVKEDEHAKEQQS